MAKRGLTERERRSLFDDLLLQEKSERARVPGELGCMALFYLVVLPLIATAIIVVWDGFTWRAFLIMFLVMAAFFCFQAIGVRASLKKANAMERMKEFERDDLRVTEVRATACIALVEVEDEGADYFFQVGPDEIFHLSGQDYYESLSFPNDHFSIIDGKEMSYIACLGHKLKPLRTLDADEKTALYEWHVPPETFAGRLATLEADVRRYSETRGQAREQATEG